MTRVLPWIAAAAAAVSANTIAGGFVWDDLIQIVANPWIRDPARLGEAFATHAVGFDPGLRTSFYRPMVHVFHAAVHAAFGLEPWAFHALNVLLHTIVSVCVYLLVARFTSRLPAALAALLFAVHPVHSEPVAWASGIYDLAVGLFVVLAVLAVTDGRARVRALAPLLFGVALLWKEPAMAFLGVAALLFWARGESRWRELAALAAAALAYLALRIHALGGLTGGDRNPIRLAGLELPLTAIGVLAEYARLLVAPFGLSPIHDSRIVTSAADPRFLIGCVLVAGVAAAGWFGRRSPGVTLGLSLLVLPLLPALYIPALKDSLLAERYLYLPSAGGALLLGLALERWPAVRVPVVAATLACAVAMFARNRAWHDNESLWSDAVTKAPASAVAWENLGSALAVERRYAEAIAPLNVAVQLDDRRFDAHTNLAIALGATGRREEATRHATRALALCPSCRKQVEVIEWLSRFP